MLIVDSFAGGGGASTGIEMALGRSPDIAINHDEIALSMHYANHPDTLHLHDNVWQVDLGDHARRRGERVGLLWASPDCTHFSKARGGKPTSPRVRGLAWCVVKFVRQLGPRRKPLVIILENVEEFRTWEDWDPWCKEMRALGYRMEWRELRACDYGAPTIRKRLFIILRCDGQKIVWPEPTHGKPDDPRVLDGTLKPWRTAAEIIDWSVPCPSIFDSAEEIKAKFGIRAKRPLAEATLKRIAAGIKRYVLDAEEPFIINLTHGGRLEPSSAPLRTVTTANRGEKAIVVPSLVAVAHGYSGGKRDYPIDAPYGTITKSQDKALVVASFMAQHNGNGVIGRAADMPVSTVTTSGAQTQLVAASMLSLKGSDRRDAQITEPLNTVCAGGTHAALVAAFMVKYYGAGVGQTLAEPFHTVTTKERFGLVTASIDGTDYVITDIGMRMLTQRELYRAQGFSDDYVIDQGADGRPISKTAQVDKCGNSVSPPMAAALADANCGFLKAAPAAESAVR